MKVFNYIIVALFTLTASFAVIVARRTPEHSASVSYVALAGVLLGWAILLGYYQSKPYRGGTASIVGAILLGIGIWSGLGELFWEERTSQKDVWLGALVTLFFIGTGVALTLQGHRIHELRANHVRDT
jgi:ABC-type Mn2+/Zn2+ transport system permease subunit